MKYLHKFNISISIDTKNFTLNKIFLIYLINIPKLIILIINKKSNIKYIIIININKIKKIILINKYSSKITIINTSNITKKSKVIKNNI